MVVGCLPRLVGQPACPGADGAGGALMPAVKHECPAPRHRAGRSGQPFVLDRLLGSPPVTGRGGGGTRLRRVLLRWQAPQPCSRSGVAATRPNFRTAIPTSFPTSFPTRWGVRTPGFAGRAHRCWLVPFVGPV